jgi:hypothetical protein
MSLAKETWFSSGEDRHEQRGKLIMTTEDESLFKQRLLFNEASQFPLDFVVNEQDSLQGSGNANIFGENADNIMISSLTALQMQFNAGHVYGNCCSNFHLMLFDFLREGCGLTTQTTCLQETKDYNVCCQWTRTEECEVIRAEFRKEQKNTRKRATKEAHRLVHLAFANRTTGNATYNRKTFTLDVRK